MKMFYIDIENGTTCTVDVEDSLDKYYELLNCRYIEIHEITVNGNRYNVICDEEGSLVGKHPSVFTKTRNLGQVPMFVGNVLFASSRVIDGEMTGLNDSEIEALEENLVCMASFDDEVGEIKTVIIDAEW